MSLELSERQRHTVAAALTVVAVVVIVLAVAALIYLIGAFFNKFSSVFLPLAVAGVLALVFNPYYEWLCARLKMPRVIALVVVFLSLLIPFVAIGWFFGTILIEQTADLISNLPQWWRNAGAWIEARWPKVLDFWNSEWGLRVQTAIEGSTEEVFSGLQIFGDKAMSVVGVIVRNIVGLLNWAVLPVYFAFFLMARPERSINSHDFLPFLKKDTRDDVIYLGTEFVNIIVSFFRGQLLIALLQGILFAIGFQSVGLSYGLVLGLMLGFLNIIPYLGSIIGLAVCLPLAFFQQGGGFLTVVAVLLVFIAVQTIEGYFLTPKIMGDRTGLHPIVIIIAIFFWGSALGGISGMILAIPLTAFLVIFWRLAKEKYIHELV